MLIKDPYLAKWHVLHIHMLDTMFVLVVNLNRITKTDWEYMG